MGVYRYRARIAGNYFAVACAVRAVYRPPCRVAGGSRTAPTGNPCFGKNLTTRRNLVAAALVYGMIHAELLTGRFEWGEMAQRGEGPGVGQGNGRRHTVDRRTRPAQQVCTQYAVYCLPHPDL